MNPNPKEKILLVDDERNILQAFQRQLRNSFEIETEHCPEKALELVQQGGPYAVVVSDMRMPKMNGVELLQAVNMVSPNTTRIMLTGNADQGTAVKAVNECDIFRFLNKPCDTETLSKAITDGIKQYRLVTAEKDLLQNTLGGLIKVLTDILSMVDPMSFSNMVSLRDPIRVLAKELAVSNTWDMELAAMLCQIGRVVLPFEILQKERSGMKLNEDEQKLLLSVPKAGGDLLKNIPRFEQVSKIVQYQDKHFDGGGYPNDNLSGSEVPLGARIIKLLKDQHWLETTGLSLEESLDALEKNVGVYDPEVIAAARRVFCDEEVQAAQTEIFEITHEALCPGQLLLADVKTSDGVLLLAEGAEVTTAAVERICNYAKLVGLEGPILVNCLTPTTQ